MSIENYAVQATLSADIAQFISAFQQAEATALKTTQGLGQKMSRGMTDVGKVLTAAVTVPLVGIGAASVKTAMDFEAGMSKVEAISGATASEMKMLEDRAKELGATTKFSASESADALSYMAMAGWDARSMYEGLPGVMNLAAASGEDLAMVSDIVTDSLTAFGLTAKDSGKFADILAAAATNSNTNVGLMGETFKYVAPLAGTLGYNVEDTAVAVGLMANAGIKGSQAGTTLRTALTRLAAPTKEVHNGMKMLGLEIEDVQGLSLDETLMVFRDSFKELDSTQQAQAASMIFGKNAMSGMLSVINASEEDYNKLSDAIYNANGQAEKMAKTMEDNLQGSLTILKSSLEGAGIAIGEVLIPKIRQGVDKITELVTAFNEMDPASQETIVQIGLIAAAVGPVLLILGQLGFAISNIGVLAAALTGPVGIGIAAIAGIGVAVGAIALELSKSSIEFELFDDSVSSTTKEAVQNFLDMEKGITSSLNELSWSGQEVTSEFVEGVMSRLSEMTFGMTEQLETQKDLAIQGIIDMYAGMEEVEQAELDRKIELVAESYDRQIQSLEEGEARIREILMLASDEKRTLTQEERTEIESIRAGMRDDALRILSETEQEYAVIAQRLKDFAGEISAEQAAEVVKNSLEQKEKTIEAAEDEYNQRIKIAEQLKREGSEESRALAEEIIQNAQKQRDEAVKAAEDMHNGVITEAKAQAEEHVDLIDWSTGEIKSKWQVMKENIITNTKNLVEDIKKSWADFKTNTKQSWEEAKQEITTNIENIKTTVSEGWSNLVTTVTTKGAEIVSSVRTAWNNAVQAAREFVSSATSVGRDIIGGFISGVTQKARELASAAANAVRGAISAAKGALGIRSPSRVFMDIGDDTMAGYIIGLEDKEKETLRSMGGLMSNITDEANKAELDFNSSFGSINSKVSSVVDYRVSDNLSSKQPAVLTLRLGGRSFRAFVDDITQVQGNEYDLEEAYGI